MSSFFCSILNLTIVGSIMVLVVLFLRFLLKNKVRKSWFVLLWLIVFCRFCIPVSIASPLSILNSMPFFSQEAQTARITTTPDSIGRLLNSTAPHSYHTMETLDADTAKSQDDAAMSKPTVVDNDANTAVNASRFVKRPWLTIAATLWLIGFCVSLTSLLIFYLLTARHLKQSSIPLCFSGQNASSPLQQLPSIVSCDLLYQCAGLTSLKRLPHCSLSTHPSAPCVLGLFRPQILLPKCAFNIACDPSLGSNQGADALRHILLHEMIHIKRKDNLKKFFSLILLCVHWFNPLLWIAYWYFQRDLEQACDEKVVSLCGETEKKSYALSLYEMARIGRRQSMKTFVSFGESCAKSRIKNILSFQEMSRSLVFLCLLLTFALCTGFMTNPAAANSLSRNLETMQRETRLVYVENDGLYSVPLDDSTTIQTNSPPFPEKLVDGYHFSHPVFSSDGTAVAFIQTIESTQDGSTIQHTEDLYAYRFSDHSLTLLADDILAFCPGRDGWFYVSTDRDGIVEIGPDHEKKVVLARKTTGKVWNRYENLSLSPDQTMLAYEQLEYHKDSEVHTDQIVQSDGVWIYRPGLNEIEENPVQIQKREPIGELDETSEDVWLPFYYSLPHPGKWSPDSSKLFLWQDVMGGSLRADGISGAVYDVSQNRFLLTNLPLLSSIESTESSSTLPQQELENNRTPSLLGYDENVQFTADGQLVLLAGSGRDMIFDKYLTKITFGKSGTDQGTVSPIETPQLTPAMPCVTSNGTSLYFAGAQSVPTDTDYSELYPIHRELYALKDGKVTQLTQDDSYCCESPILSKDETKLFFGRIDSSGAMSLWRINCNGSELKKITDLRKNVNAEELQYTLPAGTDEQTKNENASKIQNWKASDAYPYAYDNFYGRGYWGDMTAYY